MACSLVLNEAPNISACVKLHVNRRVPDGCGNVGADTGITLAQLTHPIGAV